MTMLREISLLHVVCEFCDLYLLDYWIFSKKERMTFAWFSFFALFLYFRLFIDRQSTIANSQFVVHWIHVWLNEISVLSFQNSNKKTCRKQSIDVRCQFNADVQYFAIYFISSYATHFVCSIFYIIGIWFFY